MQVLEVDAAKRRISLGLKQTLQNPWEAFSQKYPNGSVVEGEVKNKTEFGLFIGLDGDVDGMVHLSDLDWSKPGEQAIEDYKKGDKVSAKVLDVDLEKEASRSASSSSPAIRSPPRRRWARKPPRANCARAPSSPAKCSRSRTADSRSRSPDRI